MCSMLKLAQQILAVVCFFVIITLWCKMTRFPKVNTLPCQGTSYQNTLWQPPPRKQEHITTSSLTGRGWHRPAPTCSKKPPLQITRQRVLWSLGSLTWCTPRAYLIFSIQMHICVRAFLFWVHGQVLFWEDTDIWYRYLINILSFLRYQMLIILWIKEYSLSILCRGWRLNRVLPPGCLFHLTQPLRGFSKLVFLLSHDETKANFVKWCTLLWLRRCWLANASKGEASWRE